MKFLKLINSSWITNIALWGILLTPLFFVEDFKPNPHFAKGIYFFGISTIFFAFAFFTVNWSQIKRWFKHPLVLIATAWLLIAALASVFGINLYVSFWGNPERLGGLITAIYIYVLLIVLLAYLQKNIAVKILSIMSWVGGLVALFAIAQKLGFVSWWPSFERPISVMGNVIFLSTFLIMTIFITLYFALQSRTVWLKLTYGMLFIAQIIALFLAMSRGPSIGLVVGLLTFTIGWLWIKYAKSQTKFWKTVGIVFLAMIMLIGGLYLVREPLGIQRLFRYSVTEGGASHARLIVMQSVFNGALKRPILGYGPENIYVAYNDSYRPELARYDYRETFADRGHSVLIDQLAANGILGLIAMLLFVGGLFIYSIKWLKRADTYSEKILAVAFLTTITAYFVQDLVEFEMISNYIYGAILVALLLCLGAKDNSAVANIRMNWLNWTSGVVLLVVSFLVVFGVSFSSWRGYLYSRQAYKAYAFSSDYELAKGYYDLAFEINSPFAHWYLRENYAPYVAEYANRLFRDNPGVTSIILDDGIQRLAKFIEREPADIQTRANYASLNLILDDLLEGRTEGDRLFNELLRENPNREFFYLAWGKSLFLSGRVEDAKEKILQSMSLGSIPAEAYFWLGTVEAYQENEAEALKNFHEFAMRPVKHFKFKNHLQYALDYLLEREVFEDAIPLQKFLIELERDNQQYWLNLSVLYRDTGQIEMARQTALRILELFPETREDVQDFINSL